MPHINMVYPFLADANHGNVFTSAAADLTAALRTIQPFTVKFTKHSFKYFRHKKNCTLWLKPLLVEEPLACEEEGGREDCATGGVEASSNLEDPGMPHSHIVKTQEIMVNTFPDCMDVNQISDKGFTPHLSVGQFKPKDVAKFAEDFQKEWVDVEFEVKEVYLISRADFHDPFHVRQTVPLGSSK